MKCIDDVLIQKYIDGEATQEETDFIENHIKLCSVCAENTEKQKELAVYLKREVNRLVGNEKMITIPEFVLPAAQVKPVRRKVKKWIYSAAAACLLLFAVTYIGFRKEPAQEEYVLLFDIGTEFDANKPISQQDMTITIIDLNNNTIENY